MQEGGDLPEAFAVLGFAFNVQPMLVPLLHELPPGPASVSLTATAIRIVVIGVALLVSFAPLLRCRCAEIHARNQLRYMALNAETRSFTCCTCLLKILPASGPLHAMSTTIHRH